MLQQKWYQVTKNSKDNMACHIAKLQDLAHQLQTLGEPISDSMIVTKILMTLPANYSHFVMAWDSTSREQRTLSNLTETVNRRIESISAGENSKRSTRSSEAEEE